MNAYPAQFIPIEAYEAGDPVLEIVEQLEEPTAPPAAWPVGDPSDPYWAWLD